MSKTGKRLVILAAVLLLVIVGGYVALKTVLQPNSFKPQMASLVHKVSGLTAEFKGDVGLGLFPLSLRFENVTLDTSQAGADYSGPDGAPLLHVDVLAIQASMGSLLDREIKATAVSLEGVQCALLRDEKGRLNLPEPPVKEVTAEEEHVKVVTKEGETLLFSYRIRSLSMTGASVLYVDQVLGTRYEATEITLAANELTPTEPFPVEFSFNASSSNPQLSGGLKLGGNVTADPVRQLVAFDNFTLHGELQGADLPYERTSTTLSGASSLDGTAKLMELNGVTLSLSAQGGHLPQESALVFTLPRLNANLATGDLSAQPMTIEGNGVKTTITLAGKKVTTSPEFECTLETPSFSPRALLASLGIESPPIPDEKALQSASMKADMHLTPQKLTLRSGELKLDETTLSLEGAVAPSPLKGNLVISGDTLNIDSYLPLKDDDDSPDKDGSGDKGTAEKGVDVPEALRSADLRLEVNFDSLQAAKLAFKKAVLKARLNKAQLKGDASIGSFYSGNLKASYGAAVKKRIPSVWMNATARGVQLHPLLQDMQGDAPLTGTASLDTKLSTAGLDERQYRSNLNGSFSVRAAKGKILGVSLSPQAIQNAILSGAKLSKAGGSTPYQILSAQGTIKNGVATLNKIYAQADPNKASGGGTVDLVNEVMNIRLNANVLGLASFPVTISGPLDDPGFSVEAVDVVEQGAKVLGKGAEALGKALDKPEEAGESIGEGVGKALGNILEGFTQ